MDTESWCTVELHSNQDWTKAERKHVSNAFASHVLNHVTKNENKPRLDKFNVPDPKHKERRHFPDTHETQFKM